MKIMSNKLSSLIVLLIIANLIFACPSQGAQVAGRVVGNGLGIEGASVKMDIAPGNGQIEYTMTTDAFGFYKDDNVNAGTYDMAASHPAWVAETTNALVLDSDGRLRQDFDLTPGQGVFFDVYVQVACAVTGLMLEDMPVDIFVERTYLELDDITKRAYTDAQGFIHLTGMPKGFYSFTVNQGSEAMPGWGNYQVAIAEDVSGPHMANVLLKPAEHILMVKVFGYDPVTETENAPLEAIWVEAIAVDPNDHKRELLPPQTGTSGITKEGDEYWDNTMAGKVKYVCLPPVHWEIRGKRLGYYLSSKFVVTDGDANLVYEDPGDKSINLNMDIMPTTLTIVAKSVYNAPAMYDDALIVRIQGLAGTNTEGIDREMTFLYNEDKDRSEAIFEKILPGSYRVTSSGCVDITTDIRAQDPVNGEIITQRTFSVRFNGEDYAEAIAGVNRDAELNLEPVPVTLKGKLYFIEDTKFDDMGSRCLGHYGACPDIEIRASEYVHGVVPESMYLHTVSADENGEFTITLLPGLYGVVIPGLVDYWGYRMITTQRNFTEDGASSYGWPYWQIWPHSALDAMNGFSWRIAGLMLNSDQDVEVKFKVVRDEVDIYTTINTSGEPTQTLLLARDPLEEELLTKRYSYLADTQAVVSLAGPVPLTTTVELQGASQSFVFRNLTAGAYSLSLNSPLYTYAENFTVPDMDPPGVMPASLPASDQPMPPAENYYHSAQFINPESAKFDVFKWYVPPEGIGRYDKIYSNKYPDISKIGYAGEAMFDYWMAPNSPYEVWIDLTDVEGGAWYKYDSAGGDLRESIYIGGGAPSNDNITPAPVIAYNLILEGRNADEENDPPVPINNINVTLQDGTTSQSGNTLNNRVKTWEIDNSNPPTHTNWTYSYNTYYVPEPGSPNANIRAVIIMEQGVGIRGLVVNKNTQIPISKALVSISKSTGDKSNLNPMVTGDTGEFQIDKAADGNRVYFIDVTARGYEPFRKRLDPATDAIPDPQDSRTLAYLFEGDNKIQMTPLKAPALGDGPASFDRFGGVLPSIKKSGVSPAMNPNSSKPYDAFTDDDTLTMAWDILSVPPSQNYTIKEYDWPDGVIRGEKCITAADSISEVWLIDKRSFESSSYEDDPTAIEIPDAANPHLVHDFLKKISDGATPNVLHVRVMKPGSAKKGGADTVKAEGNLALWTLPKGKWDPAFVIVTEQGGITVYDFPYTGDYLDKELIGMPMPPWMGFLANTLGTVAGTQATADKISEFLPEGRFSALPKFTAEISEEDGYVSYDYGVEASLKEGMDGPMSGLIGLAPGMLGVNVSAGMEAGFHGNDNEFFLSINGAVKKEDVIKEGYRPGLFKKLGADVELDPNPTGSVKTTLSATFDQTQPAEKKITHEVTAVIGAKSSVSLMPVMTKIPYVGPVLLTIEKVADLDTRANVHGRAGLKSQTTWRTVFPRYSEHYTYAHPPDLDRQYRRHFLGGNETQDTTTFDLCFNFGVGLDINVGERAGAGGYIDLSGDACWTDDPALLISSNPAGDWPPINRIQGDVRAGITAYLNLWVTECNKEWIWKLIKIDHQFGTDPSFQWIEMEITAWGTQRSDYTPSTFLGTSPQVVQDLLTIGDYDACPGNQEAMLFTDMVETGGDMALEFSPRGGVNEWNQPITIAATDGAIIASALFRLPDDTGWMAVWTEIAENDVADPWAPSELKYSTSNNAGDIWSAPVNVAALDGVATKISLFPMGQDMGMAFSETRDGPEANNQTIRAAKYDGAAWSGIVDILAEGEARDWVASGTSEPNGVRAHVAVINYDNELEVISWDGLVVSTTLQLASNMDGALAMTEALSGTQYLAASPESGGLTIWSWTDGPGWASLGYVFSEASPVELAIASPTGCTELCLAWTDGASIKNLWYGFIDSLGQKQGQAVNLTNNTRGKYKGLIAIASYDCVSTIIARFDDDPVHELRQFDLRYPDGPVNNDRDNDGMADEEELRIVDHDPNDQYTCIDDILPDDDFDNDGVNNIDEITQGRNPELPIDITGFGDLNGDLEVDIKDVIVGLQILSGMDPDPYGGGDVNQDNIIGHPEIFYILRELSGL